MFHLLAWYNDAQADITLTQAIPVVDQIFAINNANFVPQFDYQALFAAAFSTTLTRGQLTSASIRQYTPIQIRPLGATLVPGNQPNVADYRNETFIVKELEELIVQTAQVTGGAVDVAVLLGLTRNFVPAPLGTVYTIRGTSTTAAVANVWSNIAMTWADNLPSGRYMVVGMNCFGVGEVAARLIFEDGTMRPGCVAGTLAANASHPMFNRGGLGSWGEFNSNRMPNVEVLNNTTTAVHEVSIDFVRLS